MRRTYLVVPADDPELLVKALGHGADALVVDLLGGDPATARSVAATFLSEVFSDLGGAASGRGGAASGPRSDPPSDAQADPPSGPASGPGSGPGSGPSSGPASGSSPVEIWARINPGPVGHDDVRELVAAGPGLRGVFVARTDSPVQLDALDSVLSTVESELGLPSRSIGVVASLESAGAVLAASTIARAPRLSHLFLAEDELADELGLVPSHDEHELIGLRTQVVLASVAAGAGAPIACARASADGPDALRLSTMELRRLGFTARACIDAEQVALVDELFRPTGDEVAAARDVVERWMAAKQDNAATCRDAGGRLIDEARARRAQRLMQSGLL